VKTDDNSYVIELAVAGFSKKDIAVTVENGVLTVESDREDDIENNGQEIIHRGISKRYFKKSFSVSDDVEIQGAELKDGLLQISMEKIIPESRKRKEISIK
jgi:molecular chaperone IbpA